MGVSFCRSIFLQEYPFIGVSVYDKSTYKGSTTNQYGFYSLTLPEGKYDIVYSFIGLKSKTKTINLNKDIRINTSLTEDVIITEEVEVTGERQDKNVESSEMGQIKVNVEKIITNYLEPL